MRLYTTNYDDVAVLAAKKNGIEITQVTLSDKVKNLLKAKSMRSYKRKFEKFEREYTS